jgi:hypothetical protein
MSALEAFLKRYPDGENLPQHCKDYYEIGFVDGEMFQFQITKSLEQQIQGHVLEVLKLRKELASLKAAYSAQVEMKMMAMDELESLRQENEKLKGAITALTQLHCSDVMALRPAAEALKTAVQLDLLDGFLTVAAYDMGGDPLAATIKAINRAAEAVKEPGEMSAEHNLYMTEDQGVPEAIVDRNGIVVLDLCKVCGGAEAAMPTECPGSWMTGQQLDDVTLGVLDYRGGKWRNGK